MPSDEVLVTALRKVNLWPLISSRGGLDADISSIALSHGQQQLFSLAVAIIKKSTAKIVVIDESTSGVDEETEKMMNQLIKDEFRDCTVIYIAHRLEMAREFDAIIVLGGGEVVEMGTPGELIASRGAFWELFRG